MSMNSIPFKIDKGLLVINATSLARFKEANEGKIGDLVIRESKRTGRQNRALHRYFQLLADELNAGGFSVKLVLKEKVDIDWTPELCKEALWRPAQKVILKKESTKELGKSEDITKVYDHLTRHLGEKFGVFVEWPHYETEEEYNEATGLK